MASLARSRSSPRWRISIGISTLKLFDLDARICTRKLAMIAGSAAAFALADGIQRKRAGRTPMAIRPGPGPRRPTG